MSALLPLRRLKTVAGRLRFRGYLPHTTFSPVLPPGATLSDQFLYRGDIAANRFVAENALALLLGRPVEVTHRLLFFDSRGNPLQDRSFTSDRYFTTLDLDPLPLPYATYLHATTYGEQCPAEERGRVAPLLALQRHHRGYSLYQRTPASVFAAAHGNFGGIVTDTTHAPPRQRLLARHRSTFLYTPQHRFSPQERVSLFVMNPCPTSETVEVIAPPLGGAGDPRRLDRLTIAPLGVERCVLTGVEGYLSFRSRLPMCRPLVFVETDANPHHFDVFHT